MFNLFKKHIKVVFISHATGEIIGTSNMKAEQLPEAFDKPTTMTLKDEEWEVIKADPVYASEFTATKELRLYLRSIVKMDPQNFRFSVPTITNELPATSDTSQFGDFTLELHEDDWRQIEYFPVNTLPLLHKEMTAVQGIRKADSNSIGFSDIHVRKINRQQLSISLDDFCNQVNVHQKGALKFMGYPGLVQDGFTLRSEHYTYYGTIKNGLINELCLQQFEGAYNEFTNIAPRYNLVLVSWCSGQIISP